MLTVVIVMSKGQIRSQKILEVARSILVEQGYENLTLRNVAMRVGISMGNLQYYFRAKEDLEREVLQSASDKEVKDCRDYFERSSGEAEERFKKLIRFLLMKMGEIETRGLHLQGWALAIHDNHVERLMEWLYQQRCTVIADAIKLLNPKIDAVECANRATVIHAMIVGSLFSLVTQGQRLMKRRNLDRLLKMRALVLAKG